MGDISRTIKTKPIEQGEMEPFARLPVAVSISTLSMKPTWGISSLRYSTTETGTGASVSESSGEFQLSTGTSTSNVAEIRSLIRGQYTAGNEGRWGVGVRIPSAPTGTQDLLWGYFDSQNGFIMGQDSTGIYVNRRKGGSDNKTYKSSWNIDKLDGAGPSGLTISDLSDGFITQCDFTWYGYGPAMFYIIVFDSNELEYIRVPIHVIDNTGETTLVDPNQPISFRAINGGSSDTNVDLFVGGHQFEIIGNNSTRPGRDVPELLSNFTTATNTDWQPLIAVRPKANHGPSGRTNSVRIRTKGFFVAADDELEIRLTIGGTTSNLSWGTPTEWTSAEAATETKVTGGTALTTSAVGFPVAYGFADGTNQASGAVERDSQLDLGQDIEAILWCRRLTGSGAIIVKHANLTVTEEW